MFVLQDTTVEFKALDAHLRLLAEKIVENVTPTAVDLKLSASQVLFGATGHEAGNDDSGGESSQGSHKGMVYRLKEGVVSYSVAGTILFHYEAGELFGFEQLVSRSNATVATDFAVVVDAYSGRDLLASAQTAPAALSQLLEYLACHAQLLCHLNQGFLKKNAEGAPEIRAIHAGDEIFLEGSNSSEVFTLVEGQAEAIVNGIAVGKVMPGELFGVVSALSGTARGATVRATKNCTVLVIAKDNFAQLIESRPSTVLKMVEEMARTLVSSESNMSQVSLSRF
jgi:CRP/FNR family cyclic AMP-dependent transcriptional regulator